MEEEDIKHGDSLWPLSDLPADLSQLRASSAGQLLGEGKDQDKQASVTGLPPAGGLGSMSRQGDPALVGGGSGGWGNNFPSPQHWH